MSSDGLKALEVEAVEGFGKKKIYLDAGHGSEGNVGNIGCFCQEEAEFTLRLANRLAKDLVATGYFEVRPSRKGSEKTDYESRVKQASEWADAFVSLHSDARGPYATWSPREGIQCNRNTGYHGYSVLWSGEGKGDGLRSARKRLSDSVAARMLEAGFHPYDGRDYEGLYEGDAATPGSFVDVHPPGQRIMVLRRPTVPSVIIETHQALDVDEVARWGEERTLVAFAAAVTAGLMDAL